MNRILLISSRRIFFKEKINLLCVKPCLYSSNVQRVHEQPTGTARYRSYSSEFYSPLSPIISLNNFVCVQVLRGFFEQDIQLDEFCKTCPQVVKALIESLSSDDTDRLCDVIEPACLENIIENWKKLSDRKRKLVTELTEEKISCNTPLMRFRIRLPRTSDASKNIVAYLNIRITIIYYENFSEMIGKNFPSNSMLNMPFPARHPFVFEREVTKGVDGSWRLQSCGMFP